jgi:hypothetical protein
MFSTYFITFLKHNIVIGTFSDPNEAKITFPDTQDYEIQEVLTFDVPQNKGST